MKHLLRLVTLIIVATFASSGAFAQNSHMTKAQTLGLKTGSTTQIPLIIHDETAARATFLEEGFDVDFLPMDWTQKIVNTANRIKALRNFFIVFVVLF